MVQEATERADPRVKKRDELVIPTRCGRQLYIVVCVQGGCQLAVRGGSSTSSLACWHNCQRHAIGSSSADPALLRSGMRSESSSAAPLPLPYFTPTCDHSLQVLSLHAPSAADFLPHPGMPSRSSSAATASTACIFLPLSFSTLARH